jgi:hypothetical protein
MGANEGGTMKPISRITLYAFANAIHLVARRGAAFAGT